MDPVDPIDPIDPIDPTDAMGPDLRFGCSHDNLKGKAQAKESLQKELGLNVRPFLTTLETLGDPYASALQPFSTVFDPL
eukprot:98897-Rhodomonas_salina.2